MEVLGERKKPAIGKSMNSSGNKICLNLDRLGFLGLLLKSITIITISAIRQMVKMNPASLGKLYPRVVREKTGFIKGIIFAAMVIMNQFTGHRKCSRRTLKRITVFLMKGTFGTVNHHFMNNGSSDTPQDHLRS